MTRWARGGPKKRPHEASSWEELKPKQTDKSSFVNPERIKPKKHKKVTVTTEKNDDPQEIKNEKTKSDEEKEKSESVVDKITKADKSVKKRKPVKWNDDLEQIPEKRSKDGKLKKKSLAVTERSAEMSPSEIFAMKDKRREDRRVKRIEQRRNKKVCFHCRQPGHGVADCPVILKANDQGMGICFKCGSTEHTSHQCTARVDKKRGEYPFARCFVCHKIGHLSRQCPDNPKGLYPYGGGCTICGSVKHFVKDCPDNISLIEKEKAIKEQKLLSKQQKRSMESADAEIGLPRQRKVIARPKGPKIVKF
ncbi:uncharacterized protein LOC100374218 [Saccoglossus kowalevskii]|uniref:Zinc finger CCHC domain-containing protein 9-like n=1 Tax=Saccoglossus kowalevskii TaxID=10224 RepID=A0ABM0M1Y0_SACKO|nr:PREDICTED: zinc finger CCHC domain-containing protein 9-like [Saccoglossus kowalevskii]